MNRTNRGFGQSEVIGCPPCPACPTCYAPGLLGWVLLLGVSFGLGAYYWPELKQRVGL